MSLSAAEVEDMRLKYSDLAAVVVPTEPGRYRDVDGRECLLTPEGNWFIDGWIPCPKNLSWLLFNYAPFARLGV